MFDSFLSWFFNTCGLFFAKLINLVSTPVLSILNTLIPDFSSYFSSLSSFFTNYVFKGIRFAKMAFINTLHIDTNIFSVCCIVFYISVSIFFATRFLKLVANLWSVKNNGKTKN